MINALLPLICRHQRPWQRGLCEVERIVARLPRLRLELIHEDATAILRVELHEAKALAVLDHHVREVAVLVVFHIFHHGVFAVDRHAVPGHDLIKRHLLRSGFLGQLCLRLLEIDHALFLLCQRLVTRLELHPVLLARRDPILHRGKVSIRRRLGNESRIKGPLRHAVRVAALFGARHELPPVIRQRIALQRFILRQLALLRKARW